MSYLIVVAHPDDEVLGAGGTICKLTDAGEEVNVCILSGMAEARHLRPDGAILEQDTIACGNILGIKQIIRGAFSNIKLNVVPHLELVQFIENSIKETGADIVISHYPADLNNDHVQTSLACQAAVRLFQRRDDVNPLKELLFMEVPSSTEWGLNQAENIFMPNTYVEIGKNYLNKKIQALSCYRGVMRPYPHPRSKEALEGLAAYRGSQAGLSYAEAFQSVFRRVG